MPWAPAEIAHRLRAAQPLVERVALRPLPEFGRYLGDRNDLRLLMRSTKALGEGSRDPADREPIDRRADIARSRRSALECKSIEVREVLRCTSGQRIPSLSTTRIALRALDEFSHSGSAD